MQTGSVLDRLWFDSLVCLRGAQQTLLLSGGDCIIETQEP